MYFLCSLKVSDWYPKDFFSSNSLSVTDRAGLFLLLHTVDPCKIATVKIILCIRCVLCTTLFGQDLQYQLYIVESAEITNLLYRTRE